MRQLSEPTNHVQGNLVSTTIHPILAFGTGRRDKVLPAGHLGAATVSRNELPRRVPSLCIPLQQFLADGGDIWRSHAVLQLLGEWVREHACEEDPHQCGNCVGNKVRHHSQAHIEGLITVSKTDADVQLWAQGIQKHCTLLEIFGRQVPT